MSGPTPRTHHLQAVAAPNDGWKMLLKKEVLRFWRVAFQTIAAPVLTSVLYLLIFGHVMSDRVQVYPGISYVAFLAPGLVMMSVLQNAFANSASSLVQSKIMGNLVFTLLTPLSSWHWFVAYVGAAVARALLVGLGVYLVTLLYMPPRAVAPLWIAVFALLGAGLMGVLGLLAGLWSDKFDQMATFQNFIVMPMTFLAGVFYSIHSLPGIWQQLSQFNPFFYMIDGFRYGFHGVSDVSPWLSLAVAGGSFVALSALVLYLLKTGYKLRG
ncbi:MAG: ABC transporter permease [Burkholderiales bacterium]|nr:ABC transporter permease [Burkholderiales bacterium]MBK8664813.1 ABC transporter permease [Burkholderiales bacterium]